MNEVLETLKISKHPDKTNAGQGVSDARLRKYWRGFVMWGFSGLRDLLNWENWIMAASEYFGKERCLQLLQRCHTNFSPSLALLQSLSHSESVF